MTLTQHQTPLFDKLCQFQQQKPYSFHVPGHKSGDIFPKQGRAFFNHILQIDLTELTGLDDLHAPQEIILEAQQLAAEFFKTKVTFFLVGGSTVGNLAMILATCNRGDKVIVQRNSHKSIMNGLELAQAHPVFLSPEYDQHVNRYTHPSINTLKQAIKAYPDAKAVILTYPDYFGRAYQLRDMIELAHEHDMLVLIDEAHGVHFSLGEPFPSSAIQLGADIVVQSAHKTAPAMTMASFLHVNSDRIFIEDVAYYLGMLQSSSPSYPLLASLDLARSFLATLEQKQIYETIHSAEKVRAWLNELEGCCTLPITSYDDPIKITLQLEAGLSGYDIAHLFEQAGIFPELATHHQILFIHGLAPLQDEKLFKKSLKSVQEQLKKAQRHDIINLSQLFIKPIEQLSLSYASMKQLKTKHVSLQDAVGRIAAEAIIPYPPGIPMILKGERITDEHILVLTSLLQQGAKIQHQHIDKGITVFVDET